MGPGGGTWSPASIASDCPNPFDFRSGGGVGADASSPSEGLKEGPLPHPAAFDGPSTFLLSYVSRLGETDEAVGAAARQEGWDVERVEGTLARVSGLVGAVFRLSLSIDLI